MKEFSRKIQLIQDFRITLPIDEDTFTDRFQDRVQESELGLLSDPFEQYSTKGPEYKGWISEGKFEMKLRRRMFSFNLGISRVHGTFREEGRELVVAGEINGFGNWLIPIYAITIGIYLLAIVLFFASGETLEESLWPVPLLLLHAAFMMGIPYFFIRREVGRIKRDVEEGLFS